MSVSERFLKYVGFETTSNEESESVPSSDKELLLGRYLADELKAMGIEDARLDECGYVYGSLPANKEGLPVIGLIAHMDTAPDASGADIKPEIIHYEGGDIVRKSGVITDEKTFEFLKNYAGQDLIITDGTTLLGADDKAGVAEIFETIEYLINNPEIRHGKILIGITPDEEIGCGTDHFDLENFAADFAYTIDGGALGEIEYENFNAATAKININGVVIHPGSAKDKMKNAILIGTELMDMLPPAETPAHTEGYEGFYHVVGFSGVCERASMGIIIRDHDMKKFVERKAFMQSVVDYLNKKYGDGTIELSLEDSYYNMKEKILPVIHIVERAEKAMKAAGVTPKVQPIRGGTDGARLSYEGLPCPNLSTGGENFHGVHEFVSIQSMEKMVEVLVNLVTE